MKTEFHSRCAVVLVLLGILIGVCGCAEDKGNAGNAANRLTSPEDLQKAKDKIKNDPNMPPQAKAAALSAIDKGQSAATSSASQAKPMTQDGKPR